MTASGHDWHADLTFGREDLGIVAAEDGLIRKIVEADAEKAV